MTAPDGAATTFQYGGAGTLSHWPSTGVADGCPGDARANSLSPWILPNKTVELIKHRLVSTTEHPIGIGGPALTTRADHEGVETRLAIDQNGKCGRIDWRRVTFPDGSSRRTAFCLERGGDIEPLDTTIPYDVNRSRCVAVGGSQIADCASSPNLNGIMFEEQLYSPSGVLVEKHTYGDWATMVPFVAYERQQQAAHAGSRIFPPIWFTPTYLDVRPTRVIHTKDGITWSETYEYETGTRPVVFSTVGASGRTTGNETSRKTLSATGAVLIDRQASYLHGPAYDARNLVRLPASTRVVNGQGGVLSRQDFRYDEWGLRATPVEGSRLDRAVGSARGNPTSAVGFTDPAAGAGALTATTTYDETGRIDVTRDARGTGTLTYAYDHGACSASHKRLIQTVGNALGHVTTTVTDCFTDAILSVRDPNGAKSCNQYDRFGRLAATAGPGDSTASDATLVTDPTCTGGAGGPALWMEYPALGAPLRWSISHSKDGAPDGHQHKLFVDGLGRTIQGCTELDPVVSGVGEVALGARPVVYGNGYEAAIDVPWWTEVRQMHAIDTFQFEAARLGQSVRVFPGGMWTHNEFEFMIMRGWRPTANSTILVPPR